VIEQVTCARCDKVFQTNIEEFHSFCPACEKELNLRMRGKALLSSTDVLSALLPAAVSFYKLIVQAQQEERITFDRWALTEHELIALHIAIDTAARELGVEEQPLYKDIIRRL